MKDFFKSPEGFFNSCEKNCQQYRDGVKAFKQGLGFTFYQTVPWQEGFLAAQVEEE